MGTFRIFPPPGLGPEEDLSPPPGLENMRAAAQKENNQVAYNDFIAHLSLEDQAKYWAQLYWEATMYNFSYYGWNWGKGYGKGGKARGKGYGKGGNKVKTNIVKKESEDPTNVIKKTKVSRRKKRGKKEKSRLD